MRPPIGCWLRYQRQAENGSWRKRNESRFQWERFCITPGGRITSVYFPVTCVISMMTEMKNGVTIEIATVGNEGVLGIPAFLGIDLAVARGIMQVSGEALLDECQRL